MFKTNKKNGFTLIEILVVISIIILLLGIATPSFRTYTYNSHIRDSAKAIRSLLWEAQGFSLAPRDTETTKYIVDLTAGSNIAPIIIKKAYNVANPAVPGTFTENIDPSPNLSSAKIFSEVVVEKISFYKASGGSALSATDTRFAFLVGNRTGGQIKITSSVSTEEANKAEIIIGSPRAKLKYKITVSAAANNITIIRQ
ncbi:prepilin-type N-terminal cleavage/methylation domain-containing protein [Candidatus Microgenomates bacterium]|nr:prepilin-type N-terminal cleavage/methylation domain-containing protein [Candidatus Microgenomates bacterium]